MNYDCHDKGTLMWRSCTWRNDISRLRLECSISTPSDGETGDLAIEQQQQSPHVYARHWMYGLWRISARQHVVKQ